MSTESNVILPPDSTGKRIRALNYTLSGQGASSSVWAEVQHIGDPQSGAYLALVNSSGALSVSTSGNAVSVSGNVVGVYAASQQSGWMAVISGVGATSGQVQVASSGLGTVAVSSGSVIPIMTASLQSGGAVAVSGVGATSGQLNVASSGIGAVAIASGGIIPISIISGNVVALSGIVEIVSGQTVTVVSSGVGTVAISSGGIIPISIISGNVVALSGIVEIVSGQTMTVVSSGVGTVAVSSGGVIPTILASAQSGGLVGISGGGLTISGGVTVSGSIMISGVGNTSGQLNITSSGLGTVAISSGGTLPVGLTGYQSGILIGISGGSVGLSGLQGVAISGSVTVLPNAYQSGQLMALSGGGAGISGIAVSVSGNSIVVFSGGTLPIAIVSGNIGPAAFGGIGIGTQGLVTQSVLYIADSAGWQNARDVIGSSGGAMGVFAVQQVGYSYALVSGAVLVNIKSGAAFLHQIVVNATSSGGTFTIYDSASGAVGNPLGTIGLSGTTAQTGSPTVLTYDSLHTSGIVVVTSGINWNLTALWRTATS